MRASLHLHARHALLLLVIFLAPRSVQPTHEKGRTVGEYKNARAQTKITLRSMQNIVVRMSASLVHFDIVVPSGRLWSGGEADQSPLFALTRR